MMKQWLKSCIENIFRKWTDICNRQWRLGSLRNTKSKNMCVVCISAHILATTNSDTKLLQFGWSWKMGVISCITLVFSVRSNDSSDRCHLNVLTTVTLLASKCLQIIKTICLYKALLLLWTFTYCRCIVNVVLSGSCQSLLHHAGQGVELMLLINLKQA